MKIMMLHGWDWEQYPKFGPRHQWQQQQELIDRLGREFEVVYPAMPGFDPAGEPGKAWELSDYADWLDGQMAETGCEAIIGYSFGGAVAVKWQHGRRDKTVPILLLSPALVRAYGAMPSPVVLKAAAMARRLGAGRLVDGARTRHLIRAGNPFVVHGTSFLRATYDNIVRVDLSAELADLAGMNIHAVFGADDTATPPEALFAKTPAARYYSRVLAGGRHDICATHLDEVLDQIRIAFEHGRRERQ